MYLGLCISHYCSDPYDKLIDSSKKKNCCYLWNLRLWPCISSGICQRWASQSFWNRNIIWDYVDKMVIMRVYVRGKEKSVWWSQKEKTWRRCVADLEVATDEVLQNSSSFWNSKGADGDLELLERMEPSWPSFEDSLRHLTTGTTRQ